MYAHHNIFGGGSVAFTPMEVAFRVHAARVRLPVAALVRSFAPLFFFSHPWTIDEKRTVGGPTAERNVPFNEAEAISLDFVAVEEALVCPTAHFALGW